MSKSKIRIILFFALCCVILGICITIPAYYYSKLPDKIAVVTRDDGSVGSRWSSFSIYILAMVYVSIYLVSLLVFKFYDKVKFRNKSQLEEKVDLSLRQRVYNLIKESIFAISFFLGLCILYLQVQIVKLGFQKINRISLLPLLFIFVLFLFIAFYYNKKIDSEANKLLEKYGS